MVKVLKNDIIDIDVLVIPGPSKIKIDNHNDWIGGIEFVKFQIELFEKLNTDLAFRWHLGFLEDHITLDQIPKGDDNIKNYVFKKSELKVKFVDNPSSQHGGLLNLLLK